MTQYEIYERLLSEKGMTSYQVSQKTGISPQALSAWKKRNSTTSAANLQKIADALNVDISVFTKADYEGEVHSANDPTEHYYSDATVQMAQDIFENKELKLLFDAARDADPEDLKAVHSMLLALKRKEFPNE